jgi:hypothetical protein
MATPDSAPLRLFRGSRFGDAARGAGAVIARAPRLLLIVLGVGVALRVVLWVAINPAMMNQVDSATYVQMADGELFSAPATPAGYPLFLRAVHLVSSNLDFTIAVQHLIGVATALLLYATVRRIGAPVWAGVGAAAAVALPLDQMYLEHNLLSEGLFAFGVAALLYSGVRALDPPRTLAGRITTQHAWIVAAGVTLGLMAWVRAVAAPMLPLLVLWFVFAIPGRLWVRVGRGALAGGAAASLLLAYAGLNAATTDYFGLTRSAGWAIYSRTAPFADCNRFDPPQGTSALCERRPVSERPGPDFYSWGVYEGGREPPAQRLFGEPPNGNAELGAFARQVIINQPLDYAWSVTRDTLRYFAPEIADETRLSGAPYSWMDIERRDAFESNVQVIIQGYYPQEILDFNEGLADDLTDLQALLRVHPALLLLATIVAIFGIRFSSGRIRAALVLLLGTAVLLIVIPSATAAWNARYVIPADGPFIAAGLVGLWVILGRMIERHGTGREPGESSVPTPSASSP